MHGHAIARACPGMCGIIAGCPSRPESTRCACGISLGLVRGRCSGRGPSVGRVMRPDAGARAGCAPAGAQIPWRPQCGARCAPRGADTHEHPPTHPTGARQTSRQAAREGPHAEPHQTCVLINSAPARCAGANCAKCGSRFVGLGCAAGRARPAAAHIVGRLSPVQPRRGGANGQGRARRQKNSPLRGCVVQGCANMAYTLWRMRCRAVWGPERPATTSGVVTARYRASRPPAASWGGCVAATAGGVGSPHISRVTSA